MVTKKLGKWEISEEELLEKLQRSIEMGRETSEASASRFTFNRVDRSIRIALPGDAFLTFPASNIKELVDASDEEIEQGELIANGTLLRWDKFDADYSIEGFTHGQYGTQEWMRELGRRGGQSKSPAKVAASRQNGQRGGRPSNRVTEASPFPKFVGVPEVITASQLDIVLTGQITKVKSGSFRTSPLVATTTNRLETYASSKRHILHSL